jgi:26S proteasome regulatory subunit N5
MIQEKDGNKEEAAKIMQELQVETYGSMERQEKMELILEQMRLCLITQDFIRAQIISKKVSTRFFENQKHNDLKLKFYGYMIELGQHEHDYLDICRNYRQIQDTDSVKEDQAKHLMTVRNIVLYVVLAKFDNEQSDLIHRVGEERLLEDLTHFQEVLEKFTTKELISQAAFSATYETLLRDGPEATGVFSRDEAGDKRWADLKSRVVEHNIRMMAQYYTKIRLTRMAQLLALTETETEDCLSDMVVAGTVSAKTDRLEGIVDFTEQQDPLENLNQWSSNTNKLMELVMKTTHLINKEEMVHKTLGAGAATAATAE